MSNTIKQFCLDLSDKLNKFVTYESDKTYPYIKNGENYCILVDGDKTSLLINELDFDNNKKAREELINWSYKTIINNLKDKQGGNLSGRHGHLVSHINK